MDKFHALFALTIALATVPTAFSGVAQAQDNSSLWLEHNTATSTDNMPASPYPELVETVGPAVVNINVQYEDQPIPRHVRRMVDLTDSNHLPVGSGFIIHPEGRVITNYHVIDGADSITVALDDGTELPATVTGADEQTDVALLSVHAEDDLPAVPIGDSTALRVGEYVVAIGNPMGLSHTVTAGIVSSLDRRNVNIEGTQSPVNFVQFDAPITFGNSGGPLLNLDGEVIGVTTAYNPQVQHLGFAIPANLLKVLIPQLEDQGYIMRSWLGIRVQQLTPALARSYGIDDAQGALVTEVIEDSPAERAGFEAEDVIVKFSDQEIELSDELTLLVSLSPADTGLDVEVVRRGQREQLSVTLETVPDQSPPELPGNGNLSPTQPEASDHPVGVAVEPLTETLARRLRATDVSGVVVASISPESPARNAGLRDRDVILQVAGQSVGDEGEFQKAFDDLSTGQVVRLKVLRNGRAIFVAFEH